MKKLYALLTLLLLATSLSFAQSSKEIYRKYSDNPDFEAVYISPAMLRLVGRIPDLATEEIDLGRLIKSMTGGFFVLSTSNAKSGQALADDVKKLLDKGNYELLMEAKEKGEATRIYSEGNDKRVTSIVLLSKETDETSFICIDGNIDRKELEDILAEAM